jgi:hypothetical protein
MAHRAEARSPETGAGAQVNETSKDGSGKVNSYLTLFHRNLGSAACKAVFLFVFAAGGLLNTPREAYAVTLIYTYNGNPMFQEAAPFANVGSITATATFDNIPINFTGGPTPFFGSDPRSRFVSACKPDLLVLV